MRLKRPLFRTRPIVEWSIGGIPSVKATCLSNNRSVHRCTPGRRLAARQRDHPRLHVPGHLRLHRRRDPLLAADHVLDPPGMRRERLRDQIHRALRCADPFGHHAAIRRRPLRLVQGQQHPGPGDHPGRMPPRRRPPSSASHDPQHSRRPCTPSDEARRQLLLVKCQPEQPTTHTHQIRGDTPLGGLTAAVETDPPPECPAGRGERRWDP